MEDFMTVKLRFMCVSSKLFSLSVYVPKLVYSLVNFNTKMLYLQHSIVHDVFSCIIIIMIIIILAYPVWVNVVDDSSPHSLWKMQRFTYNHDIVTLMHIQVCSSSCCYNISHLSSVVLTW